MAIAPEFPRALLRETSHAWNPAGVAATPGQTADSVAPISRSDGGGFWVCTMTGVRLTGSTRDQIRRRTLLWRAVRNICDGGVAGIVVPRNDALFRPWPSGLAQGTPAPIPHSDGSLFSDGTGYYQSTIAVQAAAPAALRDTAMAFNLFRCGDLLGGESFSILHATMGWRMYEIGTVNMVNQTQAVVTFRPPLREDTPAGADIEFDRPRCLMRLAQTGSMDLTVVPWTGNNPNVDFVEHFE